MYGAVYVCARDGYSGMIVEFAAMPIKNTNNNTKKTTNNKTLKNTRSGLFLSFFTFLFTFIILLPCT